VCYVDKVFVQHHKSDKLHLVPCSWLYDAVEYSRLLKSVVVTKLSELHRKWPQTETATKQAETATMKIQKLPCYGYQTDECVNNELPISKAGIITAGTKITQEAGFRQSATDKFTFDHNVAPADCRFK